MADSILVLYSIKYLYILYVLIDFLGNSMSKLYSSKCIQCKKIYFKKRKDRIGKFCNRSCSLKINRYMPSVFWDSSTWEQKINRLKFYFEKHVIKNKSKCWGWIGYLSDGYGKLTMDKKLISSHRASWLIHYGEIPKKLIVRHVCDNRSCTNPEHLLLGTHKDNSDDKINRGRRKQIGESHSHSKINNNIVREIRRLFSEGVNYKNIARKFNIAPTTIYGIKNRKRWSHVL